MSLPSSPLPFPSCSGRSSSQGLLPLPVAYVKSGRLRSYSLSSGIAVQASSLHLQERNSASNVCLQSLFSPRIFSGRICATSSGFFFANAYSTEHIWLTRGFFSFVNPMTSLMSMISTPSSRVINQTAASNYTNQVQRWARAKWRQCPHIYGPVWSSTWLEVTSTCCRLAG